MTKRNPGLERRKQDAYDTPAAAVDYLLPHIPRRVLVAEPCAGRGALADALEKYSCRVIFKGDIEPRREDVRQKDARLFSRADAPMADMIITNPPWTRPIMHRLIDHFRLILPTWLLMDADWAFTTQAKPYLTYCQTIVAVGRVSWMGNGVSGFDNCAWYQFTRDPVRTEFIGRGV